MGACTIGGDGRVKPPPARPSSRPWFVLLHRDLVGTVVLGIVAIMAAGSGSGTSPLPHDSEPTS